MLTPEQVNKLEEIRAKWEARFDGHIRRDESIPQTEQDFLDLFAIVDDLRKQLPKQYIEAEIIEAVGGGPSFWDYESGIVDCARFLGAIKK